MNLKYRVLILVLFLIHGRVQGENVTFVSDYIGSPKRVSTDFALFLKVFIDNLIGCE